MTKEELAQMLNGREYMEETTDEIERIAKENNLVIVHGYSDDNAELRGAIADEVSCYDGGEFYITQNGLLDNECECDDCPYFLSAKKSAKKVEAIWSNIDGYSWTYKTDIPHATFDILEDGEKFCRGIVFSLDDLKG